MSITFNPHFDGTSSIEGHVESNLMKFGQCRSSVELFGSNLRLDVYMFDLFNLRFSSSAMVVALMR